MTTSQAAGDHPVRLALVGAGIFARDAHVPSLLRLGDLFEIVAIYSRSEATAAGLAAQIPYPVEVTTDLDALLARGDVEALDVMLPITVAPAVLEQALASGKAVLSEKPIGPDVATGLRLMEFHALHPSTLWMVGENWRYEAAFLQAAELIRSGAIGEPLTCHWAVYTPITAKSKYYNSAWRRDSTLAGGFLLDGGVHHVAALRLILGEIAEVTATAAQRSPELPPVDTLAATLRFENGVLGGYVATYATAAPWPPQLYIAGREGTLRVQRREIELTADDATQTLTTEGYNGVEVELKAFAQTIRQGQPHRNPPVEALQDLAVLEAMLESAATGRAVRPARFV
jgi:predicted dehydrogenase